MVPENATLFCRACVRACLRARLARAHVSTTPFMQPLHLDEQFYTRECPITKIENRTQRMRGETIVCATIYVTLAAGASRIRKTRRPMIK